MSSTSDWATKAAEEIAELIGRQDNRLVDKTDVRRVLASIIAAHAEPLVAELEAMRRAIDEQPGGMDIYEWCQQCLMAEAAKALQCHSMTPPSVTPPREHEGIALPDTSVLCAHCESEIIRCPKCGKSEWRFTPDTSAAPALSLTPPAEKP